MSKKKQLHPNVVMFAIAATLVAVSIAGSASFASGGSSNASANPYRPVDTASFHPSAGSNSTQLDSVKASNPATTRKIMAAKRRLEATAKTLKRLDGRIATLEKSLGSATGENVSTLIETIDELKDKREKVQAKYDEILQILDGLQG